VEGEALFDRNFLTLTFHLIMTIWDNWRKWCFNSSTVISKNFRQHNCMASSVVVMRVDMSTSA
jgi:hypothetical protein